MKKGRLFLLGFYPMAVGYLGNWLILRLQVASGTFMILYSLLFWTGWFVLSRMAAPKGGRTASVVFWLCLPSLVSLALVFYQEWVRNAYWFNVVGFASQMFFLPTIPLSTTLLFWSNSITMPPVYFVGFLLLFGVCWLGVGGKSKKK